MSGPLNMETLKNLNASVTSAFKRVPKAARNGLAVEGPDVMDTPKVRSHLIMWTAGRLLRGSAVLPMGAPICSPDLFGAN
jgi:hypothetical protein